jgi:hypothetical protein
VHRDFLREVERNLRIALDWRNGSTSASRSLASAMAVNNETVVAVADFALKNVELGYGLNDVHDAPMALDRALKGAGSVWSVAGDPNTGYSLRRRITEAGDTLARQPQAGAGNAAAELRMAYDSAYGRNPDPSDAYRHAVKAVEAAAIPIVSPNNPAATLGTVIGDIRQKPAKFASVLTRPARRIGPTGNDLTPVEVTIALMDQLWHNQTDRHSPGDTEPTVPLTPEQAGWAVHTAGLLVQVFRSGWIRRGVALRREPQSRWNRAPSDAQTRAGAVPSSRWTSTDSRGLYMKLADAGLTLDDIDLGGIDAESDHKLDEYFVTTPYVSAALRGGRTLFLGRKGSGKSALFTQLSTARPIRGTWSIRRRSRCAVTPWFIER